LLVSQVLTLFSTPVVYYYLDKVRRRFGDEARHPSRLRKGPAAPAPTKELTLGGK
jgi:hypothetical protein